MCHKTTPFIVFVCNKKRVQGIFVKSKLQIMWLKTSTSILGFNDYFLTSSALKTLVFPNLCFLLGLSPLLYSLLHVFSLTFLLKTPTYPLTNPFILFSLTSVSVIRLIISNWSRQKLTTHFTAISKNVTKNAFLWKQKTYIPYLAIWKTIWRFTAPILAYSIYNSNGVYRTPHNI